MCGASAGRSSHYFELGSCDVVVVPIQEAEPGSEPEEPDPESTIEPTIEPMNEQDGPAACLDGHSVRRCRFPVVVLTSKQHARTDARTNTTTTR